MKKRILSLLLVMIMVFTLIPVYSMADTGKADTQGADIKDIVGTIKDLIGNGGSGTFGNGGSAAPAAASPKTGDGSHTEVWSALTLLCMAGLFLGLRQAKRN